MSRDHDDPISSPLRRKLLQGLAAVPAAGALGLGASRAFGATSPTSG